MKSLIRRPLNPAARRPRRYYLRPLVLDRFIESSWTWDTLSAALTTKSGTTRAILTCRNRIAENDPRLDVLAEVLRLDRANLLEPDAADAEAVAS